MFVIVFAPLFVCVAASSWSFALDCKMINWQRQPVPTDHSCLFSSLVFLTSPPEIFEGRSSRSSAITALRKYCAEVVLGDEDEWPEWKIGRSPKDYAAWIQKPDSWGGEIELIILAQKLQVEVSVINMTSQNIITYGTETASKGRVHLLYTGQHYDPIVSVTEDGKTEKILPASIGTAGSSEAGADDLKALAKEANDDAQRRKRQRIVKKIKCTDCGAVLDNASAFQAHCMDEEIDHSEDFAYECEEVTIVMDESDHSAQLKASEYNLEDENTHTFYDIPASALSNLFEATVEVDSKQFATVEHYRQYERFANGHGRKDGDAEARKFAESLLQIQDTKDLSQVVGRRENLEDPAWNGGGNEKVTRLGMKAKFVQHAELRKQLLALKGKTIVCLSDDLWGGVTMRSGLPEGKNNVGKILTELATEMSE